MIYLYYIACVPTEPVHVLWGYYILIAVIVNNHVCQKRLSEHAYTFGNYYSI